MRFSCVGGKSSRRSLQVVKRLPPWPPLQLLDIAGNQLTEIPAGLPPSLEYLYLQNNKISTVPAHAFDATPNLKGIFLR